MKVMNLELKRWKEQFNEDCDHCSYHKCFCGEVVDEISTEESLQFDFGTIREATDNFSNSKKLGQGGFGAVYMGQLSNGQEIAESSGFSFTSLCPIQALISSYSIP
ncbi:hypothetical protein NL676_007290 [Syzygium grande]|nr:hypothetical protein NL676_007290 [Syzygium grande]